MKTEGADRLRNCEEDLAYGPSSEMFSIALNPKDLWMFFLDPWAFIVLTLRTCSGSSPREAKRCKAFCWMWAFPTTRWRISFSLWIHGPFRRLLSRSILAFIRELGTLPRTSRKGGSCRGLEHEGFGAVIRGQHEGEGTQIFQHPLPTENP